MSALALPPKADIHCNSRIVRQVPLAVIVGDAAFKLRPFDQSSFDELYRFDDLWLELFPAEQARIIQLLVDRIDISESGTDITLRIEGLDSLMHDMRAAAERKTVAA